MMENYSFEIYEDYNIVIIYGWKNEPAYINFEILECNSQSDSELMSKAKINLNRDELDNNSMGKGSVKFDGCINITYDYFHFCGYKHMMDTHKLIADSIYSKGSNVFGEMFDEYSGYEK